MNLDICKKCLKSKHVNFFWNNVYNNSEHRDFYYITIVGYPFNICKMKNYKMFDTKEEVVEIIDTNRSENFINLDESCPYYAEHQMSDWNKNS